MPRKAAILLANGFEEIEAITPIDILRRAGVEVTVLGVGGTSRTGAHGVTIQTDDVLDVHFAEQIISGKRSYHAIVLPGGGPGSDNLAADSNVLAIVRHQHEQGRLVAAICAAPAVVLTKAGVLAGRSATCYPGCESLFEQAGDISFREDRVVRDGHVLTSRGAGTATEFSLELVRMLIDDTTADKLIARMLIAVPERVA